MRTLNLGILAHVDAGKTSLTERLLYAAGVIDEIGSVDDGSTQTDSLAHSGYWARQSHAHGTFDRSMSSTAGDFRNLTPLVLMSALKQAGTRVYEPMHRFHLDVPADTFGRVLPVLARLRAVPQIPAMRGPSYMLEGEIPAARVHELQQQLPALTRGEGVLECAFDHYQPVRGTIPTRPRTDHNPLNRKEYLLHVVRRV